MGATFRQRGPKQWIVSVHSHGDVITKMLRSKADAEALVRHIHKQELAGINVVHAIRQARAKPVASTKFPLLKDAVPAWIDSQVHGGDIRLSSANAYHTTLDTWVYPHVLDEQGRALGDLPINVVTREHIGGVILKAKAAGRSRSVLSHIRHPLNGFYRHLLETKVLTGTNPAGDLKYFVGRSKRAKSDTAAFFSQEEGPVLLAAAKALHPRWHVFIMTGLLGGLRWGESAGLFRGDIDFARGRIHVQRTISGNGRLEPPKNGRARYVKVGGVLLKALKGQLEAMDLEGQVEERSPEQRQLVFPNTQGRPARYSHFITHVWRPLLTKAKLRYRRYHSTRHTFATWLLTDGVDIRYVQAQLGHATIGQTVDCYGHLQPSKHEAAMDKLDRFVLVTGGKR